MLAVSINIFYSVIANHHTFREPTGYYELPVSLECILFSSFRIFYYAQIAYLLYLSSARVSPLKVGSAQSFLRIKFRIAGLQ